MRISVSSYVGEKVGRLGVIKNLSASFYSLT